MLTLNDKHEYILDGKPFNGPSVTTVLKATGFYGWMPEDVYYRDRGSFVHEAIAMYLRGTLDESSLSEGVRPFVDSAIEYIQATGYKAEHIELPLMDDIYGYCGCVDALPLRDWKNGGPQYSTTVQISTYYHLAKQNCLGPGLPISVHLSSKGKMAKSVPYSMRTVLDEYKVFLSALHVYKARQHHGLLKENL